MRFLSLPRGMSVGTAVVVGAAGVFLAPIVLPMAMGVVKSLTKAGMKTGYMLYEKGRVMAEETKETFEDLAAEAKAELAEEHGVPPAKVKKGASKKS